MATDISVADVKSKKMVLNRLWRAKLNDNVLKEAKLENPIALASSDFVENLVQSK